MPLTIAQVYADLLSKLGIESVVGVSSLVQQDCIVAINGAMQMLQSAGERFFTQEQITLTLAAGTSSYTVAKTIQSVIGPVRLNDETPLRALTSRGEYDEFDRIFLGDTGYGAAAGTPIAYYPEFTRSGSTGDIVLITFYFAPVPDGAYTAVAQVVNDAPNYVVGDLSPGSTVLPVAQGYTESVFLPIARMLICRSSQFSRPDLLASLENDYRVALATLGLKGGFPPEPEPQGRETQG